ncbi:hypothetical protein TNCV_206461 [Trichonephila clavipes]|nr:hypothetical protein TNCV_206461 [Trichonephila clavipes]
MSYVVWHQIAQKYSWGPTKETVTKQFPECRRRTAVLPHLTVFERALLPRLPTSTETLEPHTGTFWKQESKRQRCKVFVRISTFKGVIFITHITTFKGKI